MVSVGNNPNAYKVGSLVFFTTIKLTGIVVAHAGLLGQTPAVRPLQGHWQRQLSRLEAQMMSLWWSCAWALELVATTWLPMLAETRALAQTGVPCISVSHLVGVQCETLNPNGVIF